MYVGRRYRFHGKMLQQQLVVTPQRRAQNTGTKKHVYPQPLCLHRNSLSKLSRTLLVGNDESDVLDLIHRLLRLVQHHTRVLVYVLALFVGQSGGTRARKAIVVIPPTHTFRS